MNIPLSQFKFQELLKWLDNEQEKCQDKAQVILQDAKAQGTSYDIKFDTVDIVINFKNNMKFLIDNQVLEQIKDRYDSFCKFIQEISAQTEIVKEHGQVSKIVQLSNDYAEDMSQRKLDGKWSQLVKKMIQINDNIMQLEQITNFQSPEQETEAKNTITKMKKLIHDTC